MVSNIPKENVDKEFAARRDKARIEVNKIDKNQIHDEPERGKFFNTVYDRANSDAAQIPWADLAVKPAIDQWLKQNPASTDGQQKTALDIACGLGDNAEALANAGYRTIAFDLSSSAIDWARQRFPKSDVDYQTANLFDPPSNWPKGFDLINECYTLQALPIEMLEKTTKAIAALAAPGADLLVYTRLRPDDKKPDGPPWPLKVSDAMKFEELGFELLEEVRFELQRAERKIPHQFAHWRKNR